MFTRGPQRFRWVNPWAYDCGPWHSVKTNQGTADHGSAFVAYFGGMLEVFRAGAAFLRGRGHHAGTGFTFSVFFFIPRWRTVVEIHHGLSMYSTTSARRVCPISSLAVSFRRHEIVHLGRLLLFGVPRVWLVGGFWQQRDDWVVRAHQQIDSGPDSRFELLLFSGPRRTLSSAVSTSPCAL